MTTNTTARAIAAMALSAVACSGAVRDRGDEPDRPAPSAPNTPQGPAPATPGMPPPAPATPAAGAVTFEPLPAHVAAEKVKTLLTGLPLTDDELAAAADAAALRRLIDGWMATPEWRTKMVELFKYAFQQTQLNFDDLETGLGQNLIYAPEARTMIVRSVEEMFARTALAIVEEGRPFTETVTTDRFVMNPPLMSLYAYHDTTPHGDEGQFLAGQSWFLKKSPGFTYEITSNGGVPIPFEQSIDPTSPHYMRFQAALPMPSAANAARCPDPEVTRGFQGLRDLHYFLFGGRQQCGYSLTPQWTAADWQAWRMVTIRPPRGAEDHTRFFDVPKLRDPKTTELVVATPRIGFMSTLAFLANWPTNDSNSFRVTTNQALIVALGRSFDDRGTTVQLAETSDDAMHVAPGTACFACHQTLDPMRDFFRQGFSLTYYTRYGQPPVTQGTFTVDGSPAVTGPGLATLGKAIAAHPHFPVAWAQKLCAFANSSPCAADDPELLRIAGLFRASKFDFKTLMRELFSSPLVTFAAKTATTEKLGVVMSIARREALCAALENRLGLPDACALRGDATYGNRAQRLRAQSLALAVPGEGYARGDENPLFPHDPTLFFHAASENLCALLAPFAVDAPNGRFSSAKPEEGIANLVTWLAGLPGRDPRAAGMRAILKDHHTEALAGGATAREAMQSTFVLACQSPTSIALGL